MQEYMGAVISLKTEESWYGIQMKIVMLQACMQLINQILTYRFFKLKIKNIDVEIDNIFNAWTYA